MRIEQNYSLLAHNTFGLDVKTRYFVEYDSEEDLEKLFRDEYFMSQSFWHIGAGSNLLFLGDYNGIIVHSAIKGKEILKEDDQHIWIKVGAAENWREFVGYCIENGWGGLENLAGIPGEVGASAFQNIGAYGVEAADHIEEVHAYSLETGEKRIFTNAECRYAYRHSFFKETANRGLYYITYVVYRLDKQPEYKLDYGNLRAHLNGQEPTLPLLRDAVVAIRNEKLPDPAVIGNAGSFFLNPYVSIEQLEALKKTYPEIPSYAVPGREHEVKLSAAWLIDRCGFKGQSVGGASVYEKQPLVLVNKDSATGNDIAMLAAEIQNAVKDRFGVELTPEVLYI